MVLYNIGTLSTRVPRQEGIVHRDENVAAVLHYLENPQINIELQNYASSYYTLEGHLKALEDYNTPLVSEPTDSSWNSTKQYVRALFRSFGRVQAISFHDFASVPWESSSAAGYGYPGTKGEHDNYRKAVNIAAKCVHNIVEGKSESELINSTPDVAFVRTQLSLLPLKQKIRNVWGEAFHYVLIEGLYAVPIIEYFKTHNTFYFLGDDPLLGVPRLIEDMFREYSTVYCLDWSAFDATIQQWEINFAFQLLKDMLSFPEEEGGQVFDFVRDLFTYRKIVKPDGSLVMKEHGLPSGSYFTNLMGSILNFVRIQYLWKYCSNSFAEAVVQGDDSIVGAYDNQLVRPFDLTEVSKRCGWKLNWNKCKIGHASEDVTFLSRTVRHHQMQRDEMELLRRALYPEYPNDDGPISTLRVYSLWKDGGMQSNTLFRLFEILNDLHGCAQRLPREHELVRF